LIICLLIPLGAASASDINTTTAADDQVLSATPQVDTLSASVNPEQDNNTLSVSENNLLSAGLDSGSNKLGNSNSGTYADLNRLITLSNNVVYLSQNYTYGGSTDDYVITISKNITIEGNGFTINGNSQTTAFVIQANNVIINNIKIINTKSTNNAGAIHWNGDNGILNNTYIYNSQYTGSGTIKAGAILWSGDNGICENTIFNKTSNSNKDDYDNSGAVTVDSSNNLFKNCYFIQSTAQYTAAFYATQSTSNTTVYGCHFIKCSSYSGNNFAGILCSRRARLNVEYCEFTNCSADYTFITARGCINLFECNFTNNNAPRMFIDEVNLENCRFIQNTLFIMFDSAVTGVYANVINCNFTNESSTWFASALYLAIFKNSTFNHISKPLTFLRSSSNVIIDNCTFKNSNVDNTGIIIVKDNSNKVYISNNTFINNSRKNTGEFAPLYINTNGQVNYTVNNHYINNINSTSSDAQVIDKKSEDYIIYNDLFVKVNGTGSGLNDSDRCNLSTAFNKIANGGRIHIQNGIYDEFKQQQIKINYNLIGEGDNVIIKNISLNIMPNLYVKNITFTNLKNSFMLDCNVNLTNCNFTNINYNNYLIENMAGARESSIIDCTLKDSSIKSFIYSATIEGLTVDGLSFDKVTMNFIMECGSYLNNNLKHVKVYNSTIQGIIKHDGVSLGSLAKFDNVDDIKIYDSNITGRLIATRNIETSKDNVYNNITVINCNSTNIYAPILFFNKGNTLSNVHVENWTNKNNISTFISSYGNCNIINNFTFINPINVSSVLIINQNGAIVMDNITINKMNASMLIQGNGIFNSLNKLIVTNSNFSDYIFELRDNAILSNSYFENYKGHVNVTGAYAIIQDTKFINGNNTLLNGSSIYVSSGIGFKVLNCIFKGNNASNGTIYVCEDANRPVFNNCTFENNRAEFLGGALYIVSTPDNRVPVGLDYKTNSTISYSDNPDYQKGFNDFYGFLVETFMELYLINDTTGYTVHDGKTRETPSNNLLLILNLMDNAHVYFVNEGDTFEGSGYQYVAEASNLVFHGNKTIVKNLGFAVPEGYTVNVYNITFEDYTTSSSMIVNASDCVFENCSFKNVGGDTVSYGGAMLINGNNTVLKNITFINSKSTSKNSGISTGVGGALYINASNILVEDCYFKDNVVSSDGANIYISENCEHVTINANNFTFSDVDGEGHGSGVVVQGSSITITGNNFTNNRGQIGSAMSVIGDIALVNIVGNNFTNNTAISNGGLYLRFTNNLKSQIIITNNDFINNSAVNGGALFVDTCDLVALSMNENDYINNSAVNGGAVYINCPGFVLSDGVLENNSATVGGAVYVNATNVLFEDLEFTGNKALDESSIGSAIYVADNVDCNFDNVKLDYNQVYGENDTGTSGGLRGDIYFSDIVSASVDNIVFGDHPYKQYYVVNTMYRGMSIYVNLTGTGRGLSMTDTRSNLTTALNHIAPNGIIYFVDDDEFVISADLYEQIQQANLTNVTFAGVGNKNLKKSDDKKYLFIHLNQIK